MNIKMRAAVLVSALFLASALAVVAQSDEAATLASSGAVDMVQDWDHVPHRRAQEVEVTDDEGFGPDSSPPPVYGTFDTPDAPAPAPAPVYPPAPRPPRGKASTRAPPLFLDPPPALPYRLTCVGEGFIIKAAPVFAQKPYIHFRVTHASTNEDNSIQCEAECAKLEGRCKGFYYKRDGNCWLVKGYGKFFDGGFDTVRACQMFWNN